MPVTPDRRAANMRVVVLAVLAAVVTACTTPPAAVPEEPVVRQAVDPATLLDVRVAGTDEAPLNLGVEPGDLGGPGTITATPARIAGPPELPWFTPAGGP